jgi:phenylacetate-CoA ligase
MFVSRLYWNAYLGTRLAGQGRYPFRAASAVRRDQERHVRRMAVYAYRYVPYYRETMDRLGLRPSDFRDAEDLARFPILERRQVQEAPEKFISTDVRLPRCLVLCTSGSTGTPLTVYHDMRSVMDTLGHQERYRAVLCKEMGRRLHYRETFIAPPQSSAHKARRFWKSRTFLLDRLLPRKQDLSMYDPPAKNVPLINEFRPDIINSYGSSIEALFAYLSASGAPFGRPKAAAFAADGVSDAARRMIREQFGLSCFSSYNAVEARRIGFECEAHRGLHVNEDVYPLRVVGPDSRSLPPGERGEVVVSNLVNRAMVFLNYRLGDTAALIPGPCSCGRTLPMISYPVGRSDDWIELPSGERLHPQAVHTLLRDEDEVWQYQVVQESTFSFRLSLVAKETADRERLRTRLADKFTRTFGEKARVAVDFVPSIPRTAAGKIRPVVSLKRGT